MMMGSSSLGEDLRCKCGAALADFLQPCLHFPTLPISAAAIISLCARSRVSDLALQLSMGILLFTKVQLHFHLANVTREGGSSHRQAASLEPVILSCPFW